MLRFRLWLENEEPSPTSAIIVLNQDRALILRRGPTAPWMPGAWNLPGGGIDPGEQPMPAAIRECEEEAGITPRNVKFFKKYNDPEFTLHIFTGETQENPRLNYESDRYAWVSLEEVKNYRFVPYVGEAIKEVLQRL